MWAAFNRVLCLTTSTSSLRKKKRILSMGPPFTRRRISLKKTKQCFWTGKSIQHFNFQMGDYVNVHSHSLWRKQVLLTFGIEQWIAKHNSRSKLLMSSKSNQEVFKDDIKRKNIHTHTDLGKMPLTDYTKFNYT